MNPRFWHSYSPSQPDFAVVTRIYLGVVPTTFWLNGPYLPLIWPFSGTMMWALTDGEWLVAIKAVTTGICDSKTIWTSMAP
jgi:hypothetical protein